ncbi:ASFV_G_ACD_01940 [African swine fever virus]|nr:ASFV_G_ACD_01940 [African swine fever virus]
MDIWYLKYVIAYILLLTMLVIGLIYRIIVLIYRSI